jgi:signal transduction histidine kinase
MLQAEAMRAGHLAALGELAAGVAHEINNPINGIMLYAQIMIDQETMQDDAREMPGMIIKEGERIAGIVKNLLSFARYQKDEMIMQNLKEVLSDALELTGTQIRNDGIQLVVDVPDDLPLCKINSQRIQQVFLNVLSNARYALNRKFSGHHKDKILRIMGELIMVEDEKQVRLTIHDQGTGIPSDVLDRICDPFFSLKPKGEGTGLGLSISHNIVKEHGGKLWFESREGEYTKVMVDLPVEGE